MKLATFSSRDRTRIGVVTGDGIVDLSEADPTLPTDMVQLLIAGGDALAAAARAVNRAKQRIDLDAVKLEAPVLNPRKFLGLGLSYRTHVEEIRKSGLPVQIPDNQVWFNKQVTCITGPYDPIHLPRISDKLDYEGELALVIGRRCRHVRPEDAASVIAGYMICNDVSVRDWQLRSPTSTLGKSFDTHGPTGPWLSTPEEVEDAANLRVRTWVDGEPRQDGNTNDLIYSFGDMIAELSTVFTLEPGDILSTGTPSGVGAAFSPPRFLKNGQAVKVEIESLGHIENRVIPEPALNQQ